MLGFVAVVFGGVWGCGGVVHSTRYDPSLNRLIQGPGYFLKSLLERKRRQFVQWKVVAVTTPRGTLASSS